MALPLDTLFSWEEEEEMTFLAWPCDVPNEGESAREIWKDIYVL